MGVLPLLLAMAADVVVDAVIEPGGASCGGGGESTASLADARVDAIQRDAPRVTLVSPLSV